MAAAAMKSKKSKVAESSAKQPIRDAIRKEIERRGLSGYAMVELLHGRVSRTAVYRFLSDGGSTDVATAEAFLDVLKLRIV